jgi:hypothetical protein
MTFEVRISRALYLALTLPTAQICACATTPPQAATRLQAEPHGSDASQQTLFVAAPPDAGAAGSTAEADASTPLDAQALCAAYQRTHQAPQPTSAAPVEIATRGMMMAEVRGVPTTDTTVQCRIIWSRTRAAVAVKRMVTPTCCQNHPGPHTPCPPGSMQALPTTRVHVETVVLNRAGDVVQQSSRIEHLYEEPQQHHCGRRPEHVGFTSDVTWNDHEGTGHHEAALALRTMAELEALSVPAFQRLARELSSFGAPAALITRARRAARDEARHARLMGTLAREAGLAARTPTRTAARARSLFEVALENAVEGCVFETFGAAVTHFQACRAGHSRVRQVFSALAPDELAHATLAWDLDAWFATQLTAEENAQIVAAKAHALGQLEARIASAEALPPNLGLPTREEAATLCAATFEGLIPINASSRAA